MAILLVAILYTKKYYYFSYYSVLDKLILISFPFRDYIITLLINFNFSSQIHILLPQDAQLVLYMLSCVRPSVRPSQACTVSKLLNSTL